MKDQNRKAMYAKKWNKLPTNLRFKELTKVNAWGFKELNSNQKFNDLPPHVQGLLLDGKREEHNHKYGNSIKVLTDKQRERLFKVSK